MALALTEGRGAVGSALSNHRCLAGRDTALTGISTMVKLDLLGKQAERAEQ